MSWDSQCLIPKGYLRNVQELGLENAWISELIFTSLFVAFILWTFSPFVFLKKRFYTTHLYSQLLSVLVGEVTSSQLGEPCLGPAGSGPLIANVLGIHQCLNAVVVYIA